MSSLSSRWSVFAPGKIACVLAFQWHEYRSVRVLLPGDGDDAGELELLQIPTGPSSRFATVHVQTAFAVSAETNTCDEVAPRRAIALAAALPACWSAGVPAMFLLHA